MRDRGVLIALLLAFVPAGCSHAAAGPPRTITPGYWTMQARGYSARMIVEANTRVISYDVWHVSEYDKGAIAHVHYDLIGKSPNPQTGEYDVVQDGNDCGQFTIMPFQHNGQTYMGFLVLQAGWARAGFGGPTQATQTRYDELDFSYDRMLAGDVADNPNLADSLSWWDRYVMDALTPQCNP